MASIKGTMLCGRISYIRKYFGEEALDRVLEGFDEATAAMLRQGPLLSEWYPFELFLTFAERADQVCGNGDGSLLRPMAGQVAQDNLTTVYKTFFRVATPSFILKRAVQIWHQYYDSGELLIVRNEPRLVDIEISDFETPHHIHCESIAGWVQRCIQMTGARDCTVQHSRCRTRGDESCLFEVRWQ